MTHDKFAQITNEKRHLIGIVFGLGFIGLCLWFCTMCVYSVFDGTFGSMGGMLMLTLSPCAAFFTFAVARLVFYTENPEEAWGVLPSLLSVCVLYASGLTVGLLEGKLFPEEVEYRSLNLEGYEWFLGAFFFLPPMVWVFHLMKRFERRSGLPSDVPVKTPVLQFIRQNWWKDGIVTVLIYTVITAFSFTLLVFDPPLPVSESHISYEEFYGKSSFPSNGSDFCYRRTSGSFYCDFSISEEGFQNWIKTHKNWESDSIKPDSPVEVESISQEESISVVDGLVAGRRRDAGNRVSEQAVFDRTTSRAYYTFFSP